MYFDIKYTEFVNWEQFREKHRNCEFTATEGGKFSFTFIPTGLGTTKIIKCNVCGKEEDITDISNW